MNKRDELKEKYKTGDDFVSDVSKRTMLIFKDLELKRINKFDITSTYIKGDHVIFHGEEYVYDPKDWQCPYSLGGLPSDGYGWKPKLLFCYIDSEPNELTVLECKDKMINEI